MSEIVLSPEQAAEKEPRPWRTTKDVLERLESLYPSQP
jgi:hypothetical protein